jgi:hypothetical protein
MGGDVLNHFVTPAKAGVQLLKSMLRRKITSVIGHI